VGSRWSSLERKLRQQHGDETRIAGVDEVGRGPLAGPVVACAAIMPAASVRRAIVGVDDSKQLPPEERERLAARIRRDALAIGLGAASVREIDTYNIYHASTRAMRRALARLALAPDHVLIDGLPIKSLGIPHTAVVNGDARCYAIACASIVAKVTRDALMRRLARRYEAYGWDHNCGYATRDHIAVLEVLGATPHHRTSFRVKQLELDLGTVLMGDAEAADQMAGVAPLSG